MEKYSLPSWVFFYKTIQNQFIRNISMSVKLVYFPQFLGVGKQNSTQINPGGATKKTRCPLLSIESWLFNRDPYNGLL